MHLVFRFSRIVCLLTSLYLAVSAVPSLAGQTAPQKSILVYTRNYTPDGKGYVHDNIASSVAAIRKMGTEAGFAVDASDDPAVFTDGNLRQYAALVFANSNNQAFSSDAQRDAFKHYVEAGGDLLPSTRRRAPSAIGPISGRSSAANSRPIRTSSRSLC